MDNVRKSRSLRIFAEDSNPEVQLSTSRSARHHAEHPAHDEHRDDVQPIEYAEDVGGPGRFFNVEVSGALNAVGSFRSQSQRVYVSELPDSLQEKIVRDSVDEDHSRQGGSLDENVEKTRKKNVKAHKKKKASMARQSVPYLDLFKYADALDYLLMFLGTSFAILDGFMWPTIAYVQSHVLNKFASLALTDPELAYKKVCEVLPFKTTFRRVLVECVARNKMNFKNLSRHRTPESYFVSLMYAVVHGLLYGI